VCVAYYTLAVFKNTSLGSIDGLRPSTPFALIGSALIVLTTIHAQDFQDIPGDLLQNRRTLPIVAPYISRLSLLCFLLLWSFIISAISAKELGEAVFLIGSGIAVGARFLFLKDVQEDRVSYFLYNVSKRSCACPIQNSS
jgi:4-hydroxybenzoate polyprenyltransferase